MKSKAEEEKLEKWARKKASEWVSELPIIPKYLSGLCKKSWVHISS